MTAAYSKADRFPENLLLRAWIISVIAHAIAFGGWKWGQAHDWGNHSSRPRMLRLVSLQPVSSPQKNAPPPPPAQPTLLFVDVDPTLTATEPPKDAKFYGAASTRAASTVEKPNATLPAIDGLQDKVLKTTDNAKSPTKPSEPTPPELEKTVEAEAEPDTKPKEAFTRGDVLIAKPQPKPQEKKGDASAEKLAAAKPEHQRPRLLSEVAKNSVEGEKTKQSGGTKNVDLHTSLDVAGTSYGGYDAAFIDAIRQNWFQIIDENSANAAGQTVIEFRLWYDGRLTDVRITQNNSGDIPGLYCKQAILHTNPFRKWPGEMRRELGTDFRDIRFTFYYLSP